MQPIAVSLMLLAASLLAGLGLLGAFAWRVRRQGLPGTPRVAQQGEAVLVGPFLMEFGLWAVGPAVRTLVRMGASPDAISWTSLFLQFLAGATFAIGRFGAAGWLLAAGALLDAVDGAVARERGVASDAGEVLDAAVDRYGEAAAFVGLAVYYADRPPILVLALVALVGSLMVSYARAKGEAVGVRAALGAMQRHERSACLALAAALSPLAAWAVEPNVLKPAYHLMVMALAVVAVLTHVTAVRRLAFVRGQLRAEGSRRAA